MKANKLPDKIYLFENPISGTPDDRWLYKRSDDEDIEYTRTDVLIKKAKLWLAEIHRVCDITDEHGYRIELRELQARLENYMKGE